MSLLKKYKWHLLVIVGIYSAVTLWLFFFTDSPQNVPFEYEIR